MKPNEKLPLNFLPFDGVVYYHPRVFDENEISKFHNYLLTEIPWESDEVFIFGKRIITKRKVAWFAEDGISYTYSKSTKVGLAFTNELLNLKTKVEEITNENYNACLLNLYHNGEEGMGWHSDDEKSIVPNSSIASLSFGAGRKFSLKHKENKQNIALILEGGSLLEMKGETQKYWQHYLPKSKKILKPRINLTFRKMMA
ncbi:MAG: alpha-ketoglutarate-dependent dioxygenase AlkB [Bacteroidetes bacterium]|nr:alpha-ketoglutarate-dependent dioxygenase AlkB [Bacteroidota bacterium]MBU1484333.1 alpha-ketoglutarate-dependent dioxygenase AlkB [Bacteroidota bacterium]MBU2045861.1 alpha-ketoglutarate-dependent dioxygenase AlkB [Bacteroidota bacterium]MBU2266800.1 alpha-ketoglutarate-dependent dioxygenase AlkB [Bacteroidota bacterium]MBU2377003.1 alpha-ketoglutarate-dependent dioxygenase AlkB [Bacteroidota bacterium]